VTKVDAPRRDRTRRLLFTAGALLLGPVGLLAAGCSPSEPPDPVTSGRPPATEFTATVTVRGNALHIAYHLVNRSPGPLLVLNRIPGYAGAGPVPDANAVYVTGIPGTHNVQVAKRVFPRPSGIELYVDPTVNGVLTAPGATVDEQLTVPLPLERASPYPDDLGDGPITLPHPVKAVQFCLGVVDPQRLPFTPYPAKDDDGAVTVSNTGTVEQQHLLCSGLTELPG
jgi:hypothetical protein